MIEFWKRSHQSWTEGGGAMGQHSLCHQPKAFFNIFIFMRKVHTKSTCYSNAKCLLLLFYVIPLPIPTINLHINKARSNEAALAINPHICIGLFVKEHLLRIDDLAIASPQVILQDLSSSQNEAVVELHNVTHHFDESAIIKFDSSSGIKIGE